jgi:hypothetical protein
VPPVLFAQVLPIGREAEIAQLHDTVHRGIESLGMRRQASGVVLVVGILHEFMLLAFGRPQSGFGLASTALIFGQRHHSGQIGFRGSLQLPVQRRTATAQVGLAACSACGSRWPPRARSIAAAILSGVASTSHRSRHTSSPSGRAGLGFLPGYKKEEGLLSGSGFLLWAVLQRTAFARIARQRQDRATPSPDARRSGR